MYLIKVLQLKRYFGIKLTFPMDKIQCQIEIMSHIADIKNLIERGKEFNHSCLKKMKIHSNVQVIRQMAQCNMHFRSPPNKVLKTLI